MKDIKRVGLALLIAASAVGLVSAPQSTDAATNYLVIPRAELMALPTSGTAYASVKAKADASATPDVCNQDNKANVNAVAAGIIYARTGDDTYRAKAESLIEKAVASRPADTCGDNDVLALGRQLGGYVIAADFIGYRDPSFVSWLSAIRTKDLKGHGTWHVLRDTSSLTSSNWGSYALASLIAADRYLGDDTALAKDWAIFKGYGDGSHTFEPNSSYRSIGDQWQCGSSFRAINPPCTKSGVNLDGAPVEDSSRSSFPSASSYIHEATSPMTMSALLLSQAGYPSFTVSDSQILRVAQFANRMGRLNDSSVGYFVAPVINAFTGSNLPEKTPTTGGRMFGFTDYLYMNGAVTPDPTTQPTPDPTATPTPATPSPTVAPTPPPTVAPTPSPTVAPTPSPSACPVQTAAPQATPDPVTVEEAINADTTLSAEDKARLIDLYGRFTQ